MWWLVDGIQRQANRAGARRGPTPAAVARALHVDPRAVRDVRIDRRSLDARGRPPVFRFRLHVQLVGAEPAPRDRRIHCTPGDPPVAPAPRPPRPRVAADRRPIVVGAGPAGLFAALELARRGRPPLLIERGGPVEDRHRAIATLRRDGRLDPENNLVFGEGGAGTYSDGKVYTRSRASENKEVLRTFVELGAPPALLIDALPHIGTDRLARVLAAMRAELLALGVELRFHTRLTGVSIHGGRVVEARLDDEPCPVDAAVLATGHNARDTLASLVGDGIAMEARPTAIGVRVEHPQRLVDRWMYGRRGRVGDLPPGFYRVTLRRTTTRPRAMHSFCMCPGGVVVAAPERDGRVVTNGMSGSRRSGRFANAGLIVPVDDADYRVHGAPDDPLRGVRFLAAVERAAFDAGGGGFRAPAQRAVDLLGGRPSEAPPPCTYRPGVAGADLSCVLPEVVAATIRDGLAELDRRWPGFAGEQATLVGVETRTSSPVRMPRDDDGHAVGAVGLFPAGEGAGHAGGILSAAVDGLRAARRLDRYLAAGGRR